MRVSIWERVCMEAFVYRSVCVCGSKCGLRVCVSLGAYVPIANCKSRKLLLLF